MKSLIKTNEGVKLAQVVEPICDVDFVKIKVESIGLCRTDLFVAKDLIKTQDNLVLGHEFSGVVVESKSTRFKKGDKVAVNPLFEDKFMGLDFDGCIQEYVVVPSSQVIKSKKLSYKVSAYLEPVAASMAVLKAIKGKNKKIAV